MWVWPTNDYKEILLPVSQFNTSKGSGVKKKIVQKRGACIHLFNQKFTIYINESKGMKFSKRAIFFEGTIFT